MPKTLKSKEDIARLKAIKKEITERFALSKANKTSIAQLKAERNNIKSKYIIPKP